MFFPIIGLSQGNLVPNSSFETYTECPTELYNDIELVDWYDATAGTCNFLHSCAFPSSAGIPTAAGIEAFDGEGMILLVIGLNGREYAAVKLDSVLISGEQYELEVMLHLFQSNHTSIGSIGAYFSPDSSTDYSLDHTLYELPAQLQRDPDSIMSDFSIWYEWKDTLTAQGGEEFMVIGNFLPLNQVPYYQPSFIQSSAYFMDDISLKRIPKPDGINELKLEAGIFPNPANDVLVLEIEKSISGTVTLMDVQGRSITEHALQGIRMELDVSWLPPGVYFLILKTGQGAFRKKVVVQR